jgi:perosamine synthetase
MVLRLIRAIKSRLREPVINYIYDFLMKPAKVFRGRRLFDAKELKLLHKALLSQNLFGINGTMVPALEKEFAYAYGVPYGIACTSGTAALHTALGALDLNPGDEVITAPITDLGTIIPILYQNAIPVFADIDDSYTMDPNEVEKKITSRTKAIIAVHLFGNACDMEAMVKISRKHNIPLIEDCAQAHMTEYKSKYVGTFGDIGCFSFQQAKHMTTGDGGMVITSNKAYYERMKLFVDKGYARKAWGARAYIFHAPNYRMNELTGAVARAQLTKVKAVVDKRNELGGYLSSLLSHVEPIKTAPVTEGTKHSYWLYPVYLKDKDQVNFFTEKLKERKIWASAGYTVKPIYLCSETLTNKKTYGQSGCPFTCKYTDTTYEYKEGLCPQAEETLKHLVCIPLDETWSKKEVERVAAAVKECVSGLLVSPAVPLKAEEKRPEYAGGDTRKTDKVRIGIVGCGQISYLHLDAYKKNQNVELVAFADLDVNRAKAFTRKLNARAYSSHQEMLKNEKLDGVSICTIPATHKKITIDFLNAGVNVLCEKPLAVSVAEAREMIAQAKEKDLVLLPAFKFRFFEEVSEAKRLIKNGGFGNILNFRLMFGGYADMAGTWFANKKLSGGGVIIDNGSHAIDLVQYLLGAIKSVSAQTKNSQNLDVEDTARLNISLASGTTGTIDLSWSTPVPSLTYLEIYGENGTLLLSPGSLTYKFKDWSEWKVENRQLDPNPGFLRQIDHFVEAVEGRKDLIVGAQDGLEAQKVIEAAYESIKLSEAIVTL